MNTTNEQLIKAIEGVIKPLLKRISSLTHQVGTLEAIQTMIFSSLKETHPSAHANIVQMVKDALPQLDQRDQDEILMSKAHLLNLLEEKPEKKAHLRLVPKKE